MGATKGQCDPPPLRHRSPLSFFSFFFKTEKKEKKRKKRKFRKIPVIFNSRTGNYKFSGLTCILGYNLLFFIYLSTGSAWNIGHHSPFFPFFSFFFKTEKRKKKGKKGKKKEISKNF